MVKEQATFLAAGDISAGGSTHPISRLFLIFLISFLVIFGGGMASLTLIRVQKSTIALQMENIDTELKTYLAIIQNDIENRLTIVQDQASLPIITSAVMHPEQDMAGLQDLMGSLSMLGEKPQTVLLDFTGKIVHATREAPRFDYSAQKWVADLINGKKKKHAGVSEYQGKYYWQLGMPVLYNGLPEGVLVAETPLELASLFKQEVRDESKQQFLMQRHQLLLYWGKARIAAHGTNLANALSKDVAMPDLGITARYIVDKTETDKLRKRLLFQIIGLLFLVAIICMLIFHRMGKKLFVIPLEQLLALTNNLERANIDLREEIDIRKRTEEELAKHRNHFEELVKERTRDLEAANKELEAFSYSVSHDLRAPLRSMDGFSLALLEDYEDKLDKSGKDYLRRVRAGCERMGSLIDDLLQLSRLTRGVMRRETVNLSVLAKSIAKELQQAEPERQVQFEIPPEVIVNGDSTLLQVVIDNLLGNAWKFTNKAQDAKIECGVFQDKSPPVYFVKDNGVGFDMAYADKLFGTFQRLHKSTEFEGSGIGLATVQRIIHRHGGRVWAEGVVDSGATFYFTLP